MLSLCVFYLTTHYLFSYIFLYIFYLPVDWFQTIGNKKFVCFTEMFTPEKSPVGRQRTWMRCLQNQMLRIIQHGFFHLRRTSPEQKYNRTVLLIQNLDRSIRKLLPADPPV